MQYFKWIRWRMNNSVLLIAVVSSLFSRWISLVANSPAADPDNTHPWHRKSFLPFIPDISLQHLELIVVFTHDCFGPNVGTKWLIEAEHQLEWGVWILPFSGSITPFLFSQFNTYIRFSFIKTCYNCVVYYATYFQLETNVPHLCICIPCSLASSLLLLL